MTNHRVENGRRNFLLTIAGGVAGLAAGSLPARVLAQPAGVLARTNRPKRPIRFDLAFGAATDSTAE